MIELLFSVENEGCTIPSKIDEDGGYDLYIDKTWLKERKDYVIVDPNSTVRLPLGIRSVIPNNYLANITDRSSVNSEGIKVSGLIDSGFRGTWELNFTNTNSHHVLIHGEGFNLDELDDLFRERITIFNVKKALGQFFLVEVPKAKVSVISKEELLAVKSVRGTGKFGSSGK